MCDAQNHQDLGMFGEDTLLWLLSEQSVVS